MFSFAARVVYEGHNEHRYIDIFLRLGCNKRKPLAYLNQDI